MARPAASPFAPWLGAILGLGALAPAPLPAQEIYQAVLLDLSIPEVQVIVVGARGDDRIRCLLRDLTGRVRVAGAQRVSEGTASGRSTLLSIPLPLLEPDEREFAVELVRGDVRMATTEWKPLFVRARTP